MLSGSGTMLSPSFRNCSGFLQPTVIPIDAGEIRRILMVSGSGTMLLPNFKSSFGF